MWITHVKNQCVSPNMCSVQRLSPTSYCVATRSQAMAVDGI